MPENTEIRIFGSETQETNALVFADTKLQTLDRRVGKNNLYFDKEMFQQTVNDWNNIPVIYHEDGIHPTDFEAVKDNPFKAAKNIGGKMVGRVKNPHIVVEGGARLMAELVIDENEAEIEHLWQTGKLFPSTAFSTHSDGDKITTPPVPNHVLIFPIKVDKVVPGDFGAYVNSNHEVTQMTEEMTLAADTPIISENSEKMPFSQYLKTLISKLLTRKDLEVEEEEAKKKCTEEVTASETPETVEEVSSEPVEAAPSVAANTEEVAPEQKEEETHSEEVPATEEAAVTEEVPAEETNSVVEEEKVDETNSELMNEVNSLRAELEQYKLAEKEQKFQNLLHALPCGMTQTEEQKKAIREQYENDLEGLLFSVLENKAQEMITQKVGVAFTHSEHSESPYTTVGDLSKKN